MEHTVWRHLFGPEIDEGKAFWRARKRGLTALRALGWGEAPADQALVPSQESEPRLEPLSEEWFEDLDKSIDEMTRLFEELRVAPPDPEDADYILEAEAGLTAMEEDLTNCFTNLEALRQQFRDSGRGNRSRSPKCGNNGDDPFKLFRPRSLDFGAKRRINRIDRRSRPGHRKWYKVPMR